MRRVLTPTERADDAALDPLDPLVPPLLPEEGEGSKGDDEEEDMPGSMDVGGPRGVVVVMGVGGI